MTLAVDSYRGLDLSDDDDVLNLSWSIDERAVLEPEIGAALEAALGSAQARLTEYAVGDPYGDAALGQVAAQRFGLTREAFELSCGAGVGALVSACAGALAGRTVGIVGPVYPDFPEWLRRTGGKVLPLVPGCIPPPGLAAIFCEHPGILVPEAKEERLDRDLIAWIARSVVPLPVIVDESNANYMLPGVSTASLVPTCPSLVVLRGISKAYSMGALRLGYAICAPAMSPWLRWRLPPLQVSPLSLSIGAQVLSLPERVELRLFERIKVMRSDIAECLSGAGMPESMPVDSNLPYVMYDPDRRADHVRAVEELRERSIVGKRHILWHGDAHRLMRYALPLDPTRRKTLMARLNPKNTAPVG